MKTSPEAKFDCPFCSQSIEMPLNEAARGLNCPSCSKFFRPPFKSDEATDTATQAVLRDLADARKDNIAFRQTTIRMRAWNFTWVSIASFLIGVIIALVSAYNAISGNSAGSGFIVAGSFVGIGAWLYLIAQLIYIRANTEK